MCLKILDFITVAIPRVVLYNISLGEGYVNQVAEAVIGFMKFYSHINLERWIQIDENRSNESYDDLVLLMQIVQTLLNRLALSWNGDEDDDEYEQTVIQRIGNLCKYIIFIHSKIQVIFQLLILLFHFLLLYVHLFQKY